MNILIPCPHCHQLLQPPEKASKHAKLRCPLCLNELLACDLIMGVHRAWVVIDDPGGVDVFHEFHLDRKAAEASESAEVAERFRNVSVARPADSSTDVEIHESGIEGLELAEDDGEEYQIANAPSESTPIKSSPENIDWSRFKPMTHDEFQRKRRQSRSPFGLILQIVLGGVAAVPIALLIMWHLLGQDVGEAGPTVSKYLPWIVPEKFHAKGLEDPKAKDIGWGGQNRGNPIRPDNQLQKNGQPMKNGANVMKDGTNVGANGIGRMEKFDTLDVTKAEVDDRDRLDGGSPTTDVEAMAGNDVVVDENQPRPMDVRGAKLSVAIKDWQQATTAWSDFTGDNRELKSKLAQSFYRSASKVATELKWMDVNSSSSRPWYEQASSQLRLCAATSVLTKLIEAGGKRVSLSDLQDGEGIALLINVDEAVSQAGFHRLEVKGEWNYGDRAIEFRDARNGRWTEATQGEFLVLAVLRKPVEPSSEPGDIPVIEILVDAPLNFSSTGSVAQ